MAALLNPLGLKYFLLSALPATAGSNAGLLTLPALSRRTSADELQQQSLPQSWSWIIAGLLAAAIFIFVIGPGVTLRF